MSATVSMLRSAPRTAIRSYSSSSQPQRKVAILGAAGGIGQPLSLLMKLNPLVTSLSLYDIAGTPGVAADVSHVNTLAQVSGSPAKSSSAKRLRDPTSSSSRPAFPESPE
ncbi:malate dehydrogenase mitochondrial-like [Prunus yedoensis var. nudiflora]|uniref:malate dehydrogenase n=1 Tax=Prunus yedoensis var. nudiflora TaxID=2094558 RepID=A0A314YBK1_PRUYE|nr:malate dehydrogenase mitochondrial-like [Prunus yedoensis var. nudiflora]